MNPKPSANLVPSENIPQLIRQVRGERVILDADLARLYGVETRALNQACKRNLDRFPADFIFDLTPLYRGYPSGSSLVCCSVARSLDRSKARLTPAGLCGDISRICVLRLEVSNTSR